jgi:hypothetical protein
MKQTRLLSFIAITFIFYFCSCQKEISFDMDDAGAVRDSIPAGTPPQGAALNSWQFTDHTNGSFHSGIIDTANCWFEVNASWNYLNITGWPGNSVLINKDTLFLISLYLPNTVIDTGTYHITSGAGADHSFGYANNKYTGDNGANQIFCYYLSTCLIATDFRFRVISYDIQQKIIKGSFSGISRRRQNYADYLGTDHGISGSFYFQLN